MIRERRGKSENSYVRLCHSMASKGCDQLRHLSESTPAKSDLEGVKLQQRVARARVSTCKLLEFNGIKGPASGATDLKRAHRDGEALVPDGIQLQARAEESSTILNYTGADAQLGRRCA
jgi:hypothetical protein